MKDEVELENEPTESELLKVIADVNERFKEMRLKVQVDRIRATYISNPIEEVNHDD
jgi:hypothetical protein